jgi:hypothetical protein
MRKTKWWRPIIFWGSGIQLVNSYILDVKYMLVSQGFKKSNLLSQCKFRCEIARHGLTLPYIGLIMITVPKRSARQIHQLYRQPGRRLDLQHMLR